MNQLLLTGKKYLPHQHFWKRHLPSHGDGMRFLPWANRGAGRRTARWALPLAAEVVAPLVKGKDMGFFVCLAAALGIVLKRLSREPGLVVHSPLGSTGRPDTTCGSTVPLLLHFNGRDSLRACLNALRETIQEAYQYQDYPWHSVGGAPGSCFASNVLITFANVQHAVAVPEAAYDFVIRLTMGTGTPAIELQYPDDPAGASLAGQLPAWLNQVLEAFRDVETPLDAICLLTPEEREALPGISDPVCRTLPAGTTLHGLFEAQARRTPGRVALVVEDRYFTYGQLDALAGRMAAHLAARHGLGPGSLVGVRLDNDEKLIVTLLAVLKTGAAYVPIDRLDPDARVHFILRDAALPLVISEPHLLPEGNAGDGRWVLWEACWAAPPAPPVSRSGGNAYVIYTSGSTGEPKGVVVSHRSAVNLLAGLQSVLPLTPGDRHVFTTSVAFDASVKAVFLPLSGGAALCLPADTRDLDGVVGALDRYRITAMHATPSFWREVLQRLPGGEGPRSLRCVSAGGEKLAGDLANDMLRAFGGPVFNLYGPTETCINATYHPVHEPVAGDPPIGRPLPGYGVFILDEALQPLPPGVTGEICIAGAGVAGGYLHREALTRQKFVESPLAGSGKLYRTGDLGQWLPGGLIACLGRLDEQVKVRGYRVETGEMENCLRGCPGVAGVVVMAIPGDDGEPQLTAFYTGEATLRADDLRQFASAQLPLYMVPYQYVSLRQFPLRPSGKVDRDALRGMQAAAPDACTAPRNEREKTLREIWRHLLGRQDVGVTADFFRMGGNSLKATQLVHAMNQAFGTAVGLRDVFRHATIAGQAHLVAERPAATVHPIPAVPPARSYPASFGQQRQWIVDQQADGQRVYNLSGVLSLEGRIEVPVLERVLWQLTGRHESLRTTFGWEGDVLHQYVHAPGDAACRLEVIDLPPGPAALLHDRLRADEQETFDLRQGPLLKAKLYRLGPGHAKLYLALDHIVADGASLGVLMREFVTMYNALRAGTAPGLPALRIQYKDFAAWQNARLADDAFAGRHRRFWLAQLRGNLSALLLPAAAPRPAVKAYRGGTVHLTLAGDAAGRLNELCRSRRATPFALFQAALHALLYRLTGQRDLVTGTGAAGRVHPDLENQVGLFANILPIRSRVDEDQSFARFLEEVKATVADCLEHQEYPFVRLLDDLRVQWDKSRSPLFDVMLMVQPGYPEALQLNGTVLTIGEVAHDTSLFDLYFRVTEQPDAFDIALTYDAALYDHPAATHLLHLFAELLGAVAADPEQPLYRYPLRGGPGPADGETVYVLDADRHPVAAGVVGTVFVKAAQTPSWPGFPGDGQRVVMGGVTWLNTGQAGRWRYDNTLEILDVKPLGTCVGGTFHWTRDLERALCRQPEVDDCKIVGQPVAGTWCLVAHVASRTVLDTGKLLNALASGGLKNFLLHPVPAIPLTPEGYVDGPALAAVPVVAAGTEAQLEAAFGAIDGVESCALVAHYPTGGPAALHLWDVLGKAGWLRMAGTDPQPHAPGGGESRPLPAAGARPPACRTGGPLVMPAGAPATLPEALTQTARKYPGKKIHFAGRTGPEECLTYAALAGEAARMRAGLARAGVPAGAPVLLQIQNARCLLPAFWACLLGGLRPAVVAVPPVYNQPGAVLDKLYGAWQLLDRPVLLSDAPGRLQEMAAAYPAAAGMRVLDAATLAGHAPDVPLHAPAPGDTAFYQLTSGSTGVPKCIALTHEGILAHIYGSAACNAFDPGNVTLNWMPYDHVGAILTYHLKDTCLGITQVQLDTARVLEAPLRWLDCLEQYRVTHSWAPNFGYKLVADALKADPDRHWDLSAVRYLMNGGEQVTQSVVKDFLARTRSFGIGPGNIQPAFGMAEVCTAFIYNNNFDPDGSIRRVRNGSLNGLLQMAGEGEPDTSSFTELGPPMPGVEIRIADAANRVLPEGVIGRFQIRGKSVTPGYYRNEPANREAFVGEGWFNSGDLGFIEAGRLTLTGREKEMIVIRGNNLYCYEIEDFVGQLPGVLPSFVAACPAREPETGQEGLVLFYVPEDRSATLSPALSGAVTAAVAARFGVSPQYALPVAEADFPKTTSGKIQRNVLQTWFADGRFDALTKALDLHAQRAQRTVPDWFFEPVWVPKKLDPAGPEGWEGCLLLFTDDEALARYWRQHAPGQCIRVRSGTHYREEGKTGFRLCPADPQHYHRLAGDLAGRGVKVRHLVHTWNFGPSMAEALRETGETGLLSVLLALRAVHAVRAEQVAGWVVSSDAQCTTDGEPVCPGKTTLPGFLKSAGLELDWLALHHLDLPYACRADLPTLLHREAGANRGDGEVAYRQGTRLVSRLRKLAMPAEKQRPPIGLVPRGMYLVTGGLGTLGVAVGKFLLAHYGVTLLITGRTSLPEVGTLAAGEKAGQRAAALATLQALSDRVHYQAADVCDTGEMTRFVRDMEARYGTTLNGIIHLAGSAEAFDTHFRHIERHLLLSLEPGALRAALHEKVYGTRALFGLVEENPEALFLCFSSALSYLGGASAAAYAAAGSFQDHFARARKLRYPNVQTINWTHWHTGGEETAGYAEFTARRGLSAITREQGLYSLLAALQTGAAQVLVGLDDRNPSLRRHLLPARLPEKALSLHYTLEEGADAGATRGKIAAVFGQRAPGPYARLAFTGHPAAALSRNARGEVDKTRLPQEAGSGTPDFAPPRTAAERKIGAIWEAVLRREQIGVHANFFALGGDSLKATQVVARISQELHTKVELKQLFEYPTIAGLAAAVPIGGSAAEEIVPVPTAAHYPVSHAQKRLWLAAQRDKTDTSYTIANAYFLHGPLHYPDLERSFAGFVARHEVMRTNIVSVRGEPVQRVDAFVPGDFRIPVVDLRGVPGQEDLIAQLAAAEAGTVFNLERDRLFRVKLLWTADQAHVLLLTLHHIIADAWSMQVMAREVLRGYEAYRAGRDFALPPLRIQYKDYAAWQQGQAGSAGMAAHGAYWQELFRDGVPPLRFPSDYPKLTAGAGRCASVQTRISQPLYGALRGLARQGDGTLFMVALALVRALCYRYTGQRDFVLKVPVAGRDHRDLEDQVGCYVNTLLVRTPLREGEGFATFLERVRQQVQQAFAHQSYPIDRLTEDLGAGREPAGPSGTEAVVLFLNRHEHMQGEDLHRMADLRITGYDPGLRNNPFDLRIVFGEEDDALHVKIDYNQELYRRETMELFATRLTGLAEAVARDPAVPVDHLDLAPEPGAGPERLPAPDLHAAFNSFSFS